MRTVKERLPIGLAGKQRRNPRRRQASLDATGKTFAFTGLLLGGVLVLSTAQSASADEPAAEAAPFAQTEQVAVGAQAQVQAAMSRMEERADASELVAKTFADVGVKSTKAQVAETFQKIDTPLPLRRNRSTSLSAEETAAHANGTLFLQKPSPASPATFVGRGGYSADGLSATLGANLRAEMPAGSTPVQAYLYGYFQTGTPSPAEATVNFDGSPVMLTKLDDYSFGTLSSGRADVTSEVVPKVSGTGGITNFAVATALPLDGLGLVVIYSNPALPETTIAVFDGAAQRTGDTATFTFDVPLDKTVPGFAAG